MCVLPKESGQNDPPVEQVDFADGARNDPDLAEDVDEFELPVSRQDGGHVLEGGLLFAVDEQKRSVIQTHGDTSGESGEKPKGFGSCCQPYCRCSPDFALYSPGAP